MHLCVFSLYRLNSYQHICCTLPDRRTSILSPALPDTITMGAVFEFDDASTAASAAAESGESAGCRQLNFAPNEGFRSLESNFSLLLSSLAIFESLRLILNDLPAE